MLWVVFKECIYLITCNQFISELTMNQHSGYLFENFTSLIKDEICLVDVHKNRPCMMVLKVISYQ